MAQDSVDVFPDISARILSFYHPPGCPSEPQRLSLVWCVGNWIQGISVWLRPGAEQNLRAGEGGEPTNRFRVYRESYSVHRAYISLVLLRLISFIRVQNSSHSNLVPMDVLTTYDMHPIKHPILVGVLVNSIVMFTEPGRIVSVTRLLRRQYAIVQHRPVSSSIAFVACLTQILFHPSIT